MTIRVAHVSDIHFGDENAAAVAGFAEHLRAGPVDLTVISGDLTRWGEVPEFKAAARWIETLPGATLVTPGNHDAPYIAWLERIVAPFARYRRWIGAEEAESRQAPGLAARAVNTARGAQPRVNWSKGQISQDQALGVAAWLAQAEGLRVVVCHHPLMEMIGGPMTGRVWGGPDAARAFARSGADLILSGHIHAPFALPLPFGDERTYAVGAGTLSKRERGAPPSFNLLEADEAAIRVAALAWTGSHYETWRTWSLERRVAAPG